MEHKPVTINDVLEIIDNVLAAALREVRRARALRPGAGAPAADAEAGPRTSRTVLCKDVLVVEARPLHVRALVEALSRRGVQTTRDSLVSALTKRLSPDGPFVRTAANTFGLAGRDAAEEP